MGENIMFIICINALDDVTNEEVHKQFAVLEQKKLLSIFCRSAFPCSI